MAFSIMMIRTGLGAAALLSAAPQSFAQETQNAEEQSSERGWSQADEYWGREEMAASRAAVQKEHGASTTYFVQADRFEYRSNEGEPQFL